MERPSHMILKHQSFSHRLTFAGLSLFLPAGLFWLVASPSELESALRTALS